MKIITENSVYVQKGDIIHFNQVDSKIPSFIYTKVYTDPVNIIDDSNRYEFIKFDDASEIEFFKGVDWIIDYDEVKELSEDEILSYANKIMDEKNAIAVKFNSMNREEKDKNMNMVDECDLLDFKIYSLRDFLWFRQGDISMTLPEGIEYPEEYKMQLKNQKGIRKVLKKIFKK